MALVGNGVAALCDNNHSVSTTNLQSNGSALKSIANGGTHFSNNNVNSIENKNLVKADGNLSTSFSHGQLCKDFQSDKGSKNIRDSLMCEAVLNSKNKKVKMAMDDNLFHVTTPLLS